MGEFWGAGLGRIKADAQARGCNERFGLAERCVTVVAGLCVAREKQVNLRVIPMSTPSPSRSDWRMNFPIACFGGSGANSQGLGCPLRPQVQMLFRRVVVQILPEPSLDFCHAHPLAFVIVGDLIAVDLAEAEISRFWVGKVKPTHARSGPHRKR